MTHVPELPSGTTAADSPDLEVEALKRALRESVELNRTAATVIEQQPHGRLVLSIPAAEVLVAKLRGGAP